MAFQAMRNSVENLIPDIIFIGSGGTSPCLCSLDFETNEIQDIVKLGDNQSIYSIDANTDNEMIAVGTKDGQLCVTPFFINNNTTIPIGAPILSVCWIDNSTIALSDIAGNFMLWDLQSYKPIKFFKTNGETICRILNTKDGLIISLSANGRVCWWDVDSDNYIHSVSTEVSDKLKALLPFKFWPATNSIVYPGKDGQINIINLENHNIKKINAHTGDVYAMTVQNEYIVTVGMKDCKMKFWGHDSDQPISNISVPQNIIGINTSSRDSDKFLLIKKNGTAGVYQIVGNKIEFISNLPGTDYRISHKPTAYELKTYFLQKNMSEINEVICRIREHSPDDSGDDLNHLHSKLEDAGYRHISLSLKAYAARQAGESLKELECYSALYRFIKHNTEIIDPISFEKYADILSRYWQIHEANTICNQILADTSGYNFTIDQHNISRHAAMLDHNHIIEPDIPIEEIIKSSSIIDKAFTGRYVISRLAHNTCKNICLNCNEVLTRYASDNNLSEKTWLPEAQEEDVWWLSEKVEQYSVIKFVFREINTLQFIIHVLPSEYGTIITPLVIFNWIPTGKIESIQANNQSALSTFANLRNNPFANNSIGTVHNAVNQSIRKLLTIANKGKIPNVFI